jgi:hypothetical protein
VQSDRPARLKSDKVDSATLAQLLRADLLPEVCIAPAKVHQFRTLLRHQISLVRPGTRQRNLIHAVVADFGYGLRAGSYLSGPGRGRTGSVEQAGNTLAVDGCRIRRLACARRTQGLSLV